MADSIDAGAVQRVTGVPVTTLNVWINHQLIPGVSGPARGKARLFSLDLVIHIAITAALVRLGYGSPFASMAATEALAKGADRPGAKLIVGPPRRTAYGVGGTPTVDYVQAETPEDLDAFLNDFIDGRPTTFTVVELDRLAATVRDAFESSDLAEQARRQRGMPERRSVRKSSSQG